MKKKILLAVTMMIVSVNSAGAYVDQHFGINADYSTTDWIENQTNVTLPD